MPKFEQWKLSLEDSLKDTQQAFQKAHDAVAKAATAPADARKKSERLLAEAQADLSTIQNGNGIHNITYALQMLDGISARCGEAVKALPAKK